MDKLIRWRIAVWFTVLSTVVYVVPTILAIWLFNLSMTANLDSELQIFSASFGHAIRIEKGTPVFRDWARTVETDPPKTPAAIQLFDKDGVLKEKYGITGLPFFCKNKSEVHSNGLSMRVRTTPLKLGDALVGYLQIQIPTTQRDLALSHLLLAMSVAAPLVLLGLGWCSNMVSEKAIMPIRQSNEMLRQFIADASHELNTPLSIIQAAAESQEKKLAGLGIDAGDLETILKVSDRMSNIVDDLMLLSNAENDNMLERQREFSISELISEVVSEFRGKFEAKGVALQSESIPDIKMSGEPEAIHRLFANLLQNALTYTDAKGQVKIISSHDNGAVRICVIDTGVGIPAQSLSKVFDRFYRVDQSRSRSSGGSGLGLAIAKAVAKAHRGDIEVSSSAESGSQFTVVLPTP